MYDIVKVVAAVDALLRGAGRKTITAAEVLRLPEETRDALEALLTREGWPDALRSPRVLGCTLAKVADKTIPDGRELRRQSRGRWYVAQGEPL